MPTAFARIAADQLSGNVIWIVENANIVSRGPMPSWFQKFFRGSSKAKAVKPLGDATINLAAHPVVNLQPKFVIEDPAVLPVWFDFSADHGKPATYDGVFWGIEPWGEYLYYLAGAFQKNHKGLLLFGTAPFEVRAERNFETDAISARLQDADRAQEQAHSSKSWQGMTVEDACHRLLLDAQALGSEYWIGSFKDGSSDILKGRSRLSFGRRFQTGEPQVEVIYERYYPNTNEYGEAFIFEVKTLCWLAEVLVDDVIKLHEDVAANYLDVPPTRVSGATKM